MKPYMVAIIAATDGAYVEWSGEFMVSDFPLKMTTPPELVREIK